MTIFAKFKSQRISVGIGLGLKNITAVAVSHEKWPTIVASDIVTSDVDYYGNLGFHTLKEQLGRILQSVTQWIGRRYVTIRVAIDNPVMYSHTLNVDTFPKNHGVQKKLIEWQIAKAFGMSAESLHVSFSNTREIGSDNSVFITAVDKTVLEIIESEFDANGIIPECIMMSALFRRPVFSLYKTSCVAQILVNLEYISIEFWGTREAPLCIRSFWRRVTADYSDDEIIDSIRDIERTIHAFSVSNTDIDIAKIIIYTNNIFERQCFKNHFHLIAISEFKNEFCEIDTEQILNQHADISLYFSAVTAALA